MALHVARSPRLTRTFQERLPICSSRFTSSGLVASSGRSHASRSTRCTTPYSANAAATSSSPAKNGARTPA